MGKIEESSQKKRQRKNIQSLVLRSVAFTGALAMTAVAPNVLGVMDKFGIIPRARQKEIINRARDRLLTSGYLRRENGFLRLTSKGRAKFLHEQLRDPDQRRRRWDGRWRLLIFDIPESRKGMRDKIRRTVEGIGFIRLQDSVWIYPYACEDFVALLKADFKIGKDLLYMIVEELEGDQALRQHFQLH